MLGSMGSARAGVALRMLPPWIWLADAVCTSALVNNSEGLAQLQPYWLAKCWNAWDLHVMCDRGDAERFGSPSGSATCLARALAIPKCSEPVACASCTWKQVSTTPIAWTMRSQHAHTDLWSCVIVRLCVCACVRVRVRVRVRACLPVFVRLTTMLQHQPHEGASMHATKQSQRSSFVKPETASAHVCSAHWPARTEECMNALMLAAACETFVNLAEKRPNAPIQWPRYTART
eukprot:5442591-Amphidinium_carterae.1